MSADSQQGGGFIVAALVIAACYVSLPQDLLYHGKRFLKIKAETNHFVIQNEVERAAKAYRLPKSVLKALVAVESAYNPKAVSKVGARGLSQIMPFNAARCGLNVEHLWDPTYNLRCGAQILREELDRVGNLKDALAVYNCGKIKCAEGQQYAKKVLALSTVY